MIWLLKNWRLVATALAILSIWGTGLYIRHLRSENKRLSHTLEIANNNYSICQTQKQNTEKAANEWEDKASDINSKYASLNRRLRNGGSCVPVLPSSSQLNEATGKDGSTGSLGISVGEIIEEARDCDLAIEKLILLQNYLRQFQ